MSYSEIGRAGSVLADLLAAGAPAAERWSAIAPASAPDHDHDPAGPTLTGGPSFVTGEVRDAVEVGEEVLLLRKTVPVRLSAIGATIWREAQRGADLAALVEAAVREHGPHPDAETLVEEAVGAMVAEGVLDEVRAM